MEDKIINQWIWSEHYQRYYWQPVYCSLPEGLEVDDFGQVIEKKEVHNKDTEKVKSYTKGGI